MLGRRRRADVGKYVEPPLAPLAPTQRVADEGALIYVSAARAALRNHIIVDALGQHIDFDPSVLRGVVRSELERLATDNDEIAARLDASRPVELELDMDDALIKHKREDHRRRPAVHRLIADALRALARSNSEVELLVSRAQADAVDEMFRAIQSGLVKSDITADGEYEEQRAKRIHDFVHLDLLGSLPNSPIV